MKEQIEKQAIEEMTKDICEIQNKGMKCAICDTGCDCRMFAEALYNTDYRKQEWISVEERLPEGKAPIIVTDGEKVIVAYRNWLYRSNSTGKLRCPANYGNGMEVTHWMPLPDPPKMKGGAE